MVNYGDIVKIYKVLENKEEYFSDAILVSQDSNYITARTTKGLMMTFNKRSLLHSSFNAGCNYKIRL